MSSTRLAPSELIINPDGSIYHLHLKPEDIARTIITVGDPERVKMVSQYFDEIHVKKSKREFHTHTGRIGNTPISVISTGIGTDNIDIVFNELDALVNIDFDQREIKAEHTALNFIRIGTSGALQADIPVDSFVVSDFGVGFDGLMHFYQFQPNEKEAKIEQALKGLNLRIPAYVAQGSTALKEKLAADFIAGITTTCTGFYAPQGRALRLNPRYRNLLDDIKNSSTTMGRFTNFEMETAGIYGMSRLLGHQAISLNAILANRVKGTFSAQPKVVVKKLIEQTLERV